MRYLIDGYNVMHAGGRLGPKLSREGFRRARRRFLDELAETLGPLVSAETTVVFDASVPPGDFAPVSTYRGLTVLFALGDENADARIEEIVKQHPNPKTLTVVSSDNRIKLAATRRRCRSFVAEKFWELIDTLKESRGRSETARAKTTIKDPTADRDDSRDEALYWMAVFGDLDQTPEMREASARIAPLLTDEELEQIQREIDGEP